MTTAPREDDRHRDAPEWTAQDDIELVKRLERGDSVQEAAQALGRDAEVCRERFAVLIAAAHNDVFPKDVAAS